MLPGDENQLLTQTDPGTPAGDFMRCYWQPVALSTEVTSGGKPKQLQVMGEPLVLFRDDGGRPGLLGLHCSHRRTSLAYGRVEDGGIRCPFHGWLYDLQGRCLEQPAEPEDSTFKDKIRHPAYPCQELGGLMFAYMGPADKMPLLPRYEVLVREDGTRKTDYYDINSNFLQNVEGAVDTVHFSYLHMDHWSEVKAKLATLPKPRIEFEEADFGIWQKSYLPNVQVGIVNLVYTYFFMPAGFMRVQGSSDGGDDIKKFQSWYVPIDDTHTRRFQAAFAPLSTHGEPYEWPAEEGFIQPGPENDYFCDYGNADTISGIPCRAPGTAIKGFLTQDNMVNETQGPIIERDKERLSSLDR
ncbi:MAG TPA: Rieske 2Fe-2S domain-containing protein, partial [Chloroflexota bacterium]|nr:Rieske 2Fe-2S domain-containing protein [Chloroflexota bacterium]